MGVGSAGCLMHAFLHGECVMCGWLQRGRCGLSFM